MQDPVPNDAAPPRTPDAAIADLRERLTRQRRGAVAAEPLLDGMSGVLLDRLLERWRHGFDWRAQEDRIRALPWVTTDGDVPLRMLRTGPVGAAPAVVLLHGWPDSVLRFSRLLPLLTDLDVVVPALPGFPFALAPGGLPASGMAAAVGDALDRLGLERVVLSAGDVGTDVAEALVAEQPGRVAALHLTDVSQYHFLHGLPDDLTPEEQAYVRRGTAWQQTEGGYMHEQSTKPATLAVGLRDSPAGLLAWIAEKLVAWTDHGDDLSSVFTDDELLTWVSAYWFSGAIGTSFTPYAVPTPKAAARVEVPTVLTVFPRDLVNAPRSFAERLFDVRAFVEPQRGGHFAAWEQPGAYADGVRAAVALASLSR